MHKAAFSGLLGAQCSHSQMLDLNTAFRAAQKFPQSSSNTQIFSRLLYKIKQTTSPCIKQVVK